MNRPRLDESGLDEESEIVPSSEESKVEAALVLISEAAAAIRQLEEQAVDAVARAHSIAEAANARAERADRAQRKAEAEVAEFNATVAAVRGELDTLRTQIAAAQNRAEDAEWRADEAERRADEAERRADEANASIDRIVDAIHAQLPTIVKAPKIKQN